MDANRSSANAVRRVRIRRSCVGVTVYHHHQRRWRAPFGLVISPERYTPQPTIARPNGVLLGTWCFLRWRRFAPDALTWENHTDVILWVEGGDDAGAGRTPGRVV